MGALLALLAKPGVEPTSESSTNSRSSSSDSSSTSLNLPESAEEEPSTSAKPSIVMSQLEQVEAEPISTPTPNLLEQAEVSPTMPTASASTLPDSNVPSTAKSPYHLTMYHSTHYMPTAPGGFFPKQVTDDYFFSFAGWKGEKVLFGIPHAYFHDQARGHAISITGLANSLTPSQVANLFKSCGLVKKVVTLIDMNSEEVARWIIMAGFEAAFNVLTKFNGLFLGTKKVYTCWAFPPGWVVACEGRNLSKIRAAQYLNQRNNEMFRGAIWHLETKVIQPDDCGDDSDVVWHDSLIATGPDVPHAKSTAESGLNRLLDQEENLDQVIAQSLEIPTTQVVLNETEQVSSMGYLGDGEMYQGKGKEKASEHFASSASAVKPSGTVPVSDSLTASIQKPLTALPHQPIPVATPIVRPAPIVAPALLAAPAAAPVPVAGPSTWASVAAPVVSTNKDAAHLMIDLNPVNKSVNLAPKAAPIDPAVVAFAQGESHEEQLRVVFIWNLPTTIGLEQVSNAIHEGPLLKIQFGTDAENGTRYAGVIFQYAADAETFHEVLVKEKQSSRPQRFKFTVDAGRGDPYPYDDELALMDPPENASRRITIAKRGFFFMFGRSDLKRLCTKLVDAQKIQTLWLYNGGNGVIIFADVKSALTVKTELQRRATSGTDSVFEDLLVTFSKDPSCSETHLSFKCDLADLNRE